VIDRSFGFDQTPEAYQHLEVAGHMGKVVVTF
jgi:NADPH:quinone reductase-like Zn-dependent oxidoreductase